MLKYLSVLLTGIVVSLFYFPITLGPLPKSINTKMILAVVGGLIFVFRRLERKDIFVPKQIFWLSLLSVVVSLVGLVSVVCNGTSDLAYATYFLSMWVWLAAAYAVICIINATHKSVNVTLVSKYLIAVCLFQCIIAQIIDVSPVVASFVKSLTGDNKAWLESVNRLYGIGAELDTAGIRFSLALVLSAFLAMRCTKIKNMLAYVCVFVLITVLGSMVARTTYVGTIIGLLYLAVESDVWRLKLKNSMAKILGVLIILLIILVPIAVYQYNVNPRVYKLLRFAFEGFFNLYETGEWSLASNEKLKTMIVFPETLKTWIIGDGYFSNPYNTDPYYVGDYVEGWYMGTDIGYLRFIFYFGVTGLISFVVFIIYSAKLCWSAFDEYSIMFMMLLLVGLVVWFKVSTDIFLVFALFISLSLLNRSQEDFALLNRCK